MPAQPSIHPVLTRKGPVSSPVTILTALVAALLIAYALGYLPQFGSLFDEAVRFSRARGVEVLTPILYGIAGVLAFLLLLGFLRSLDFAVQKLGRANPLTSRRYKTIARFVAEATEQGVSLRVARESYHLLQHFYPGKMCVDLKDNLRENLSLSDEDMRSLHGRMLLRCDRHAVPDFEAAEIETVQDLLLSVEDARLNHLERSSLRGRTLERRPSSDQHPTARPAPVSDSRSRSAARFSGLHRRASDYDGPRRRSTDTRSHPNYLGIPRRASDRAAKIQPEPQSNPTTAKFNECDAMYTAPRNRRKPLGDVPVNESGKGSNRA